MQEIVDNRNVSKEIIVEALKESLVKAYRKEIDVPDALVEVELDEKTGNLRLFHQFLVVEEVEDDELEKALDEITDADSELKVGDYYRVEEDISGLGRAAATLAKNVIRQKIREAEKQAVYDEYIDQLGELVHGMIESVEERFVVVNLGKALGVMPKTAQIPGETYREGHTIKVVITDVNRDTKGSQIIVSRASEILVRRLFEKEVPEIYQGQVEIKAIAREAGERTKIAVYSYDPDIDPIGACIGPRGSRVQVIIEELMGEKVDIFEWSDNAIDLVKNALSPAEILAVFPNPNGKGLMVVVDDSQLSLAIGKRGKNARLAVRLTKQRIDIKSQTEANTEGLDYEALMADFEVKIKADLEAQALARSVETLEEVTEAPQETVEVVEDTEVVEMSETEIETESEARVSETAVEEVVVEGEPVTLVSEDDTMEAEIEEIVESTDFVEEHEQTEEEKEIIRRKRPVLKPRADEYVSKFEQIASASKKNDEGHYSRRRRKVEREEEKPVNTAELLKQKEYSILPEYSEEELEEINAQRTQEQEEWYDDDIDFDIYDEYYDKD